ncbi:MAG: class I SAM-dependent methyltransferase [Gemmatimonadaceae bacterium]
MSDSTSGTPSSSRRADYGLDAPRMVKLFALLAGVLLSAGAALVRLRGAGSAGLASAFAWMGGSFAWTALLMIASSRWGKLRARDALLDRLALRGDETVLDVGCGHGLMLLGAARRLPRGRAVGIDLWSQKDQAANRAQATLDNAALEGVADRVEVRDGDMRRLPFDDASMDAVVSSLAIHNVPTAADRAVAISEIVRVLRPGGRVGILDIAHVGEYARELRKHGCVVERLALVPTIFPPTRSLVARKS